MADDPFDPHHVWNLSLPFYLRKVDAKWHMGSADDPPGDRIDTILANVLVPDDDRISVYLVRTREDLRRVVVGLDANRKNPGKEIRFAAFSEEEIKELTLVSTSGMTNCRGANALHRDIVVKDVTDLHKVAEAMVRAGREDRKFSKRALQCGREEAKREFCNAMVQSWGCACVFEDSFRTRSGWEELLRIGRRIASGFLIRWREREAASDKATLSRR